MKIVPGIEMPVYPEKVSPTLRSRARQFRGHMEGGGIEEGGGKPRPYG